MPRPRTRYDASARNGRARYRVLRRLGYDGRTAHEGAGNIRRFVELVRLAGRDPADFGSLARKQFGGRPRVDTPQSRRRTAWYHELRGLGASSAEASEASKVLGRYEALRTELLSRRSPALHSEPS